MVPTFGFSVGDFIAAIGLIAKVSKALKDRSGASNEYQYVLLELQALERTLRHLQALQPTASNVDHVNAIRGMALTCRVPLEQFLEKMQKYEKVLGPFTLQRKTNFGSMGRKSQWAVFMSDEVTKLRTAIGAKVLSINLLLATHISESISRIEADAHKAHTTLLANIIEQRVHLEKTDNSIREARDAIEYYSNKQLKAVKSISNRFDASEAALHILARTTNTINTTVMSFRNLGIELLQLIRHLPSQVRDALELVVRTNLEIYSMLRIIHNTIHRSPFVQPGDSILFEDVLGRTKHLPYEYFCHYEVLSGHLKAQFKGLPGEMKIRQGQYLIFHANREGLPIPVREWNIMVFPGVSLVMSILVEQRYRKNRCPRIGCTGHTFSESRGSFKICDGCGLGVSDSAKPRQPSVSNGPIKSRSTSTTATKLPYEEPTSSHPQGTTSEARDDGRRRTRGSTRPKEKDFWRLILEPPNQEREDLRSFRRVHLRYLSPEAQAIFDTDRSRLRPFDLQHTRSKLPNAPNYLIQRLSNAITRRRQYLYYRNRHTKRITLRPSQGSSSVPVYSSMVEPGILQISESTEGFFGETSALYNFKDGVLDKHLPKASEYSEHYQCPLCARIVSIHDERKWLVHAYRDLHPYLCTIAHCPTPDFMYTRQREWLAHETEVHGLDRQTNPHFGCPLCKRVIMDRPLKDHIGQHMRELACFALPRGPSMDIAFWTECVHRR